MSEIERVQYKLMLPVQLKAALEESAHDHRRSLSAEIIMRLYESLDAEEKAYSAPSPKGPTNPDDQALLDAHGMTEEQAKDFVLAFLNTYDRIRKKPPPKK